MNALRWSSIRSRLTAIIMITSSTAVLLTCAGFTISGLLNLRSRRISDLSTVAELVSSNSTSALAFGDRKAAQEVLYALRPKPSIVAAAIYDEHGALFARYEPNAAFFIPPVNLVDGIHDSDNRLELFYPIVLDHERIGTLYVASDQRDRNSRLAQYGEIAAGIVFISLMIALLLSWRLQGGISGPIVELARVARLISRNKDFSARAHHRALSDRDEIGDLMTGFNGMLAEIEQRDERLLLIHNHLEGTVARRTEELTKANEELLDAKQTAEKIAELNARLARESALILNSATDGILGISIDNRPTFLNPAGSRMLGLTLQEMQGKTFHDAVHHKHADGSPFPQAECENAQSVSQGEPIRTKEDTFWRPDGTSFAVEYASTPMFDENGRHLGAVVMFRDITERLAIDRLKSEFVSTVSHELRTPLTSIRGALGLLSSGLLGPVAEKGQRMLEIAVTNTDRLIRLINDILDLERIGSGKVELIRGPVDARAVMLQAVEGIHSMAEQAGVLIVVEPSAGTLWGDRDRIMQTLTNLLGNAIKFSPRGSVTTLSGISGETDFVFSVADEGRGVPEKSLETIFERFSQVDASDSRGNGGSGLGLAICQSIVIAHGGRIWAESNAPAGSRFQFTIPLAVPEEPGTVTAVPLTSAPYRKTVLVYENDSLAAVGALLESRGFGVVRATSPAGAAAIASNIQPDAIVLNIAAAGDRQPIVELLQSSNETRDIPIVVTPQLSEPDGDDTALAADRISAARRDDDLIEALNHACDAPCILLVEDDSDLARVVITLLHRHGIRTFHAVRGAEAIRLSRQHEPSLIVLDLTLPDIDGFAVVGALRESEHLLAVPLIVYSAQDVGSADRSRLRLGTTEFLTKSRCTLSDFEAHVVRLLAATTKRKQEERDAAA
ncbi:MAG: hypothetical protein QOK37_4111 [Thermoanaerobaculia bacterium]|jgi:PAS domain S-box-containing protein|nr:hypothetical protein [Thermoanaerobaculia bacterium]